MNRTSHRARIAFVLFAVSLGAGAALAQPSSSPSAETLWRNECGSCHVPYAPRLLPAADWRRVMASLDRHFDDDASVEANVAADIGAFLDRHAGRRAGSPGPGLPRITTTRWFVREHDEVSERTFSSPKVKSAANCDACHRDAATGDFDEDGVRIPR